MKTHLRIVEGEPRGSMIPLHGPTFVIGHEPGSDWRPKDLTVADRHCELLVGGPRLAIRDLGSPSGTRLNGLRIIPECRAVLRPGDRIQIGETTLEVADGESAVPPEESDDSSLLAIRLLQRRLGGQAARSRTW